MTVTDHADIGNTGSDTAAERRRAIAAALGRLAERYEVPGTRIGPKVEAVALAWRATHGPGGHLIGGDLPTDPPDVDDIRDALLLLPRYRDDVTAVQADLIRAARAPGPDGKPALKWREIGELLGYPPPTQRQNAYQLALRLVPDTTTDDPDDTTIDTTTA